MKTLFTTVLDELYLVKINEMLKRDYCKICRYDDKEKQPTCIAPNLTRCPVVMEQIAILEAGLFGIKEFKKYRWLDLDREEGE